MQYSPKNANFSNQRINNYTHVMVKARKKEKNVRRQNEFMSWPF